MSILRVIGDIHGCIDNRARFNNTPSYIELCKQLGPNDYSIQLGDIGFNYDSITNNLDSMHHVFLKGNHDVHDEWMCMNALGNRFDENRYGPCILGPFNFFFVSGGFSLDKKYRIKHEQITGIKSYWENEELSQAEGRSCLDLYERIKPDVVMAHECPDSIARMMDSGDFLVSFGWPRDMISSTQQLLQQLIEIHRPKLFLYGHWHREFHIRYEGTDYYCLPERKYLDFNEEWSIVGGSCYLPY